MISKYFELLLQGDEGAQLISYFVFLGTAILISNWLCFGKHSRFNIYLTDEEKAAMKMEETKYVEMPKELRHIKINYDGMFAYAKKKGVQPGELSDEEKDWFIINSSMAEIKKIWADHGVIWK